MTLYTVYDQYMSFGEESVYGTQVAGTRFFEFTSESLKGKYERITAKGLRAGQRVARADRWAPNPKGADGEFKTEVLDSSFGLLFKHAMGAYSVGTATNSITPITYTIANLQGTSATWQVGRWSTDGGLTPFTYGGGKVHNWELSSEVDQVLSLSMSLDFQSEAIGAGSGALALATPTYNTGSQVMTYIGGTATVAGTVVNVKGVTLKVDNSLDVTRYFMGANNLKKEPLEQAERKITFDLKCEYDSQTQLNRVTSATAAGAMASIALKWITPQGGYLTATMPMARFDTGAPQAALKVPEVPYAGEAMDAGTGALTLVYGTIDTAI